jgi:hypothetical protein
MEPSLDLRTQLDVVDFPTTLKSFPKILTLIPKPLMQSKSKISWDTKWVGKISFAKKLFMNAFYFDSKMSVYMPSIQWVQSTSGQPVTNASPSSTQAKEWPPLLPDWPIFKNSKAQLTAKIDHLRWNEINLTQVQSQTQLENETLQSKVSAQQAPGNFELNLKIPLNMAGPNLEFEAKIKQISINPLVKMFSQSFKDYVSSGALTGDFKGTTSLPGSPSFLERIQLNSQFQIQNAKISFPLDQLIFEKLKSFPQILLGELKPWQPPPTPVEIHSVAMVKQAQVHLDKFNLKSGNSFEVVGNGQIRITDLLTQMELNAFLSQVPFGGSMREANSDSLGRVIVPVTFQGPLSQLSAQIGVNAIQTMVKNTAQLETKKAQSRAKNALDTEVKKATGQYQKEMEKRLEDFKNKVLGN